MHTGCNSDGNMNGLGGKTCNTTRCHADSIVLLCSETPVVRHVRKRVFREKTEFRDVLSVVSKPVNLMF